MIYGAMPLVISIKTVGKRIPAFGSLFLPKKIAICDLNDFKWFVLILKNIMADSYSYGEFRNSENEDDNVDNDGDDI